MTDKDENMKFLNFCNEKEYVTNRTNQTCKTAIFENAEKTLFDSICKSLTDNGYTKYEERTLGDMHIYNAYRKEDRGVFVNYFENTREISVSEEDKCNYFNFNDESKPQNVKPFVSQLHLEDFGMSYAVRLSDGRFIIIDGGREFEPDAKRLYEFLKENSLTDKPDIAAWIFTHPHEDHFFGFFPFWEKYQKDVLIENILYNFPSRDDFLHYPSMKYQDKRFDYDTTIHTNMLRFEEYIKECGANVYIPHTGQKFLIGDASVEILACMDDTIHKTEYINATSLVMKMTLGGQTIFWGADAGFCYARIPERYGKYLKSDILQIPHHGFEMGDPEAEIEGYKFIKPSVCFLPVSEYNAYNVFCIHTKSTRFIMEDLNIEELITGDTTRTIYLPYTAPEYAKNEMKRKYTDGLKACGAKTWVFSNLNTGIASDLEFTFLNTTHRTAKVWIEFYFEDPGKNIRYLTVHIDPCCMKTLDITGEETDDNDVWFNWMSVKERGICKNSPFTVRFLSDLPIVVSNKNHKESYCS
ncbi:MAG: MBL fold metallo-hydrolase [Ruminococcaceae bacterium]|nr:MBL fold metallo-hydrolase [Oscillospiraceae bacterium]